MVFTAAPGVSLGAGAGLLLTAVHGLLTAVASLVGEHRFKAWGANAGDLGLIPGMGRSPGEGKGYSLQYSGLENPMDCIVHGVAKSRT